MKGFDTPQKLTTEQCEDAKRQGYEFAFRYFSFPGSWKALTLDEAERISNAGLYCGSVFERDPLNVDYFKRPNIASTDLDYALENAAAVRQPKDSAIYFSADYDAQHDDLEIIGDYAECIDIELKKQGYVNGMYGNGLLLNYLQKRGVISKLWLSESKGFAGYDLITNPNLRQIVSPKINLAGSLIDIDLDESNGDSGGWKL